MANNSSLYYIRQETNKNNLDRWQNWSMSINYVVDQFNDVINGLTERLEIAENTIEALNIKLNALIGASFQTYVKLQYDTIQINSLKNISYVKSCGVFSNVDVNKPNIVYVYTDKTIEGLYVNEAQVQYKSTETAKLPFTEIQGSEEGTIITIRTNNATKIGGISSNIKLYYSLDSSLQSLPTEAEVDSSTAIQKIKINYSNVVTKSLVTLDKSDLGRAIIKDSALAMEKSTVNKYGVQVGQYSSTKTAATIANQRSINRTTTTTTRNKN